MIATMTSAQKKDCSDAKDIASNAYDYFRKAYRATTLEDAQFYAKKGMNEAEDAESEADDCDCDDAESVANDTYYAGRKVYNAETLEDAQYYAKKAMYLAEEITSTAEDCED